MLASLRRMSLLKNADELPVAPGNFRHGGVASRFLRSKINKRFPEIRPANGEADETFDPSRRRQPLAHFVVVFATTKNDAADFVSPIAMRGGHGLFAVLAAIESLYLPDIRFNAGVLQLLDRLKHQPRTEVQVVGFGASPKPIELRLLCRNQQLKHESAPTLATKVVGQLPEARGLSLVQHRITLGVVANKHFAERRLEKCLFATTPRVM